MNALHRKLGNAPLPSAPPPFTPPPPIPSRRIISMTSRLDREDGARISESNEEAIFLAKMKSYLVEGDRQANRQRKKTTKLGKTTQ